MRLAVFMLLVVVVAGGCGGESDDPEERRAALVEFMESVGLEPLPDDTTSRLTETQSPDDYPHFTGTGILRLSRPLGLARAESTFEQLGWEVLESGDADHVLGSCVRARKGSMVAVAYVGWSEAPANDDFPRVPGLVYAETLVGREGSNRVWTDPDRPTCGA